MQSADMDLTGTRHFSKVVLTEHTQQHLWFLDETRRRVNIAAEKAQVAKEKKSEAEASLAEERERHPELAKASPGMAFCFWFLAIFNIVPVLAIAIYVFAVVLPYAKELGYGWYTTGLASLGCGIVVTAICTFISMQRNAADPDSPPSELVETLKSENEYRLWQYAAVMFALLIMGTVGYTVLHYAGIAMGFIAAGFYGIALGAILFSGRLTHQSRAYIAFLWRTRVCKSAIRWQNDRYLAEKQRFISSVTSAVRQAERMSHMIPQKDVLARVPFSTTTTGFMRDVFPELESRQAPLTKAQVIEEGEMIPAVSRVEPATDTMSSAPELS